MRVVTEVSHSLSACELCKKLGIKGELASFSTPTKQFFSVDKLPDESVKLIDGGCVEVGWFSFSTYIDNKLCRMKAPLRYKKLNFIIKK